MAFLLLPSLAEAQAQPPDPQLVEGIRQVKEGDFETAVLTLDGVTRRLAGDPARRRDLAQACVYLGIAYLALDQRQPAHDRFLQALEQDHDLRLSPDRFSPKVVAAFEQARKEAEARRPGGSGGRSKLAVVVLGAGAAAGAIALAAAGGGSEPQGVVEFANARFGTPVIECPNGFRNEPIAFAILVDASNGTGTLVTINTVSSTAIIVDSAIPSEVGLASSRPSNVAPDTVGAQASTTLTITSSLLCDNAAGNPPRFNEWSGRVTLTTSSGTFTLETADRLRVNIP